MSYPQTVQRCHEVIAKLEAKIINCHGVGYRLEGA